MEAAPKSASGNPPLNFDEYTVFEPRSGIKHQTEVVLREMAAREQARKVASVRACKFVLLNPSLLIVSNIV